MHWKHSRAHSMPHSALLFDWVGWDICSDNTWTSSRSWRSCCSHCCAILPDSSERRHPEDERIPAKIHSAQKTKIPKLIRKLISRDFFPTQQFLLLNSKYSFLDVLLHQSFSRSMFFHSRWAIKSRVTVFNSCAVIRFLTYRFSSITYRSIKLYR